MSEGSEIVRQYARLGAQMGAVGATLVEAARAFNAAFAAGARAVQLAHQHQRQMRRAAPLGESDAIEQLRQRAYEMRVEHERRIGLAFVRAEGARVRRELGLS